MLTEAVITELQERWRTAIRACNPYRVGGRVVSARGLMLTCRLPAALHDRCEIVTGPHTRSTGEVVGFTNDLAYLFLYENGEQVRPNMPVINRGHGMRVPAGPGLLGRVIDGLGRPIDDRGPLRECKFRTLQLAKPSPLKRARVRNVFVTGVRASMGS